MFYSGKILGKCPNFQIFKETVGNVITKIIICHDFLKFFIFQFLTIFSNVLKFTVLTAFKT